MNLNICKIQILLFVDLQKNAFKKLRLTCIRISNDFYRFLEIKCHFGGKHFIGVFKSGEVPA